MQLGIESSNKNDLYGTTLRLQSSLYIPCSGSLAHDTWWKTHGPNFIPHSFATSEFLVHMSVDRIGINNDPVFIPEQLHGGEKLIKI